MIRIASIVGARPQFIKAAVVSSRLRAHPRITEVLIHTGQHYSQTMSDVFFKQLEIPKPDVHLGVGKASPVKQVGDMLIGLDSVFKQKAFDWILVYGDTNSTLASALAAVKVGIPLAHVEAGLRSYNRAMPEEINRVTTDHLSDLLFTPTQTADSNLKKESIPAERIFQVGDVMYDSVLHYWEKARHHSSILPDLNLEPWEYILCTIHRAENADDIRRLDAIFKGLRQVSKEIDFVLPLHPRTKATIDEYKHGDWPPNGVHLIEPVSYLDMLQLEANAKLVVTDSGGVQKEAFFLGVPCVILRTETEWTELIEKGGHTLAPPVDADAVASSIFSALTRPAPTSPDKALFGDGHAAEKILETLLRSG